MLDWFEAIKKISAEKQPKISFNWLKFWKSSQMWLLGGFLAFLPLVMVFIKQPVENLTLKIFFNSVEIIYVSVTMATIALCDKTRKITGTVLIINVLVIFMGALLYGMLKNDAIIPILTEADGLSIFNIIYFLIVLFIGLLGYITICFEKGVRVK